MNIEMEELFAPGVIEKTKHLKDTEQIPHHSHAQFPSSDAPDGQWGPPKLAAICLHIVF